MPEKETIAPLLPRNAFPLLARNADLVYLDSASSAQKPKKVLESCRNFYETQYANVGRGTYPLSEAATHAYEEARRRAARFIGARDAEAIIFTHNATEALNLVAYSWGRHHIRRGDVIVLSLLEHHSNFVPWQQLAIEVGAELRFAGIDAKGDLDLNLLDDLIDERARLVCVTAASNVTGGIVSIEKVAAMAHRVGALVVVDAAQAAAHLPIDVAQWDCDFLAITGHKLYGPDGIGALYGRKELLQEMPPFQTGGGMIRSVAAHQTTFAPPPWRFEAGTPPIGAAIGLAAAMDIVEAIGWHDIMGHEQALLSFALNIFASVKDPVIVGAPANRIGILSFAFSKLHPHDVGTLLAEKGICVRTGHHCAEPFMTHLDLAGTVRASFALHTGSNDIVRLAEGLEWVYRKLTA